MPEQEELVVDLPSEGNPVSIDIDPDVVQEVEAQESNVQVETEHVKFFKCV